MSDEPIKLTVNITPAAFEALERAADREDCSRTDTASRALVAWDQMLAAKPGEAYRLHNADGTVRATFTVGPVVDARFGVKVLNDNGHHVRFGLFAATDGQHLASCGHLIMRTDEYAAFRALLEPALTDRADPGQVTS